MDLVTHLKTIPPPPTIAPIAVVRGEPWLNCPKDLYIPPDALEISLEAFAGPLDLLLYLIKRENLDILDIPIVTITTQYMEYVEFISGLRWELAVEYLAMAATLAEIKSRMLLPQAKITTDAEVDPRANLVLQLQNYAKAKQAAQNLDALPRLEREVVLAKAALPNLRLTRSPPQVVLGDVMNALQEVLRRAELFHHHHIVKEPLSLQDRIASILQALNYAQVVPFSGLFLLTEGRAGIVVTFIAILELLKIGTIELIQQEGYGAIQIRFYS